MKKNKKSKPDKLSDRPAKKNEDEDSDMREPNPDDPYEETGPPIKEMPKKSNS